MIPGIPLLTPGPRLYAEIGMLVAILALSGATITYRALYKAEHTRVAEQLSGIAADTAKATSDAWLVAYNDLLDKNAKDAATADKATKDAATRARRAETALAQLRREQDEESTTNPCLNQPLSPATRERLRNYEDSYRRDPAAH